MSYQIVDNKDVDEPVSIAEQKAFSSIDQTYVAEDNDLLPFITAARVILEQQLNIGMVRREVELQWDGRKMELPFSPTGDVTAVTADEEALSADEYTVDKRQAKTISINAISSASGLRFFYETNGNIDIEYSGRPCYDVLYKATYTTGYEVGKLPKNLKQAIMAQCDFMYKRRGMPDDTVISSTALRLAKGYSRNLVL